MVGDGKVGSEVDDDRRENTEDDGADTVTWDRSVAAPRIAPDPLAGLPPRRQPVSESAETVVTESGAAMPQNMDLHVPSGDPSGAPTLVFERIEPSAVRGERFRLDPDLARIRVGRSETNEFRLYSASTSRKHAVLERNFAGEWVLSPLGGKDVKVDGYPLEDSVVLEAGMNLVIGGDHLRCLDEAADSPGRAREAAGRDERARSYGAHLGLEAKRRLIGWLLALLGLGILLAVLVSSRT